MSDVKVVIVKSFNDGVDKFYQDEVRFMSPEKAEKFKAYGWISVGGETDLTKAGPATLNIHNGKIGQTVPTIGS